MTLSLTQGALTLITLTGLTFTAGDGTADAAMTFHGTLADINTALATASYAADANFNGSATSAFTVTDRSAAGGDRHWFGNHRQQHHQCHRDGGERPGDGERAGNRDGAEEARSQSAGCRSATSMRRWRPTAVYE